MGSGENCSGRTVNLALARFRKNTQLPTPLLGQASPAHETAQRLYACCRRLDRTWTSHYSASVSCVRDRLGVITMCACHAEAARRAGSSRPDQGRGSDLYPMIISGPGGFSHSYCFCVKTSVFKRETPDERQGLGKPAVEPTIRRPLSGEIAVLVLTPVRELSMQARLWDLAHSMPNDFHKSKKNETLGPFSPAVLPDRTECFSVSSSLSCGMSGNSSSGSRLPFPQEMTNGVGHSWLWRILRHRRF